MSLRHHELWAVVMPQSYTRSLRSVMAVWVSLHLCQCRLTPVTVSWRGRPQVQVLSLRRYISHNHAHVAQNMMEALLRCQSGRRGASRGSNAPWVSLRVTRPSQVCASYVAAHSFAHLSQGRQQHLFLPSGSSP